MLVLGRALSYARVRAWRTRVRRLSATKLAALRLVPALLAAFSLWRICNLRLDNKCAAHCAAHGATEALEAYRRWSKDKLAQGQEASSRFATQPTSSHPITPHPALLCCARAHRAQEDAASAAKRA